MNPEQPNNGDLSGSIFPKYNSQQPQPPQNGVTPPQQPTPPQQQIPPQPSYQAPPPPQRPQVDMAQKAAEKHAYNKFVGWTILITIIVYVALFSIASNGSPYIYGIVLLYNPLVYIVVLIVIGLLAKALGKEELGKHFLKFAIHIVVAIVIALLIGFGACLLLIYFSGGINI